MAYTMLKNEKNRTVSGDCGEHSLKQCALRFVRENCQGLRFDHSRVTDIFNARKEELDFDGTGIRPGQVPYNMEKDIDRLCLENAIQYFLDSGRKEDAFNVYFCYLEMFVGEYEKSRRMIELLSEFEANGSGLLMKHRDHYSHSVYVFCLGLAIYQSNETYRTAYKTYYEIDDEHEAACHFLQYWGLASLFHDIGYPFELPFEEVCSYFEVEGEKRDKRPFLAYHGLDAYTKLNKATQRKLGNTFGLGTDKILSSTDELFAYALHEKLGDRYYFSGQEMLQTLKQKPTEPNRFGHFMDHAYFSATVLFKKLFEDVKVDFDKDWDVETLVDALTAILLHNSLYKFSVAFYKNPDANIPLQAEWHPLAFLLMLCDELQCWDRTAYGRNSKLELHPMDCRFVFADDTIHATYIFDKGEQAKIDSYLAEKAANGGKAKLKAYSSYDKTEKIKRTDGNRAEVTEFQADIERIIDLSRIRLEVDSAIEERQANKRKGYLSESKFINLYTFASVLNGMWSCIDEWKKEKASGSIEKFLSDPGKVQRLQKGFGELSLEYKLYNINQAKAFAKYMDTIGCFYADKPVDYEMVDHFTKEEIALIGPMEHRRWLQEHADMGWLYGTPDSTERDFVRQHKDMIPDYDYEKYPQITPETARENYDRLGKAEQDKDTDPMECMLAMLKLFDGLRIYRLR